MTEYVLGRNMVLPLLEGQSAGVYEAVKRLYEERDELQRRLDQSNEVVEYLLNGGDPARIRKHEG
jgi:uncharacterized protein (UPF0297 family)